MKQCVNCSSENIEKVVLENHIFYLCKNCGQKNTRYQDTSGQIKTELENEKIKHSNVAAIIQKNDKYLLLNRKDFPYGTSLPIGHIYNDETPEQAIERKIFQETGLTITSKKLILHETFADYCKYGGEAHDWFVYLCQCDGNVITDSEATGHIWVEKEEIENLALIPSVKYVLAKLGLIDKRFEEEGKKELLDYADKHKSKSKTGSMIDKLPMPIMIFNQYGSISDYNASARELWEKIQKTEHEKVSEYRAVIKNTITKVLKNKRDLSSNIQFENKSLNFVANYFSEDDKSGVIVTVRDIAKAKDEDLNTLLAYQNSLALTTSASTAKILGTLLKQLAYALDLTSASIMLKKGNFLETALRFAKTGVKSKKPVVLKMGEGVAGRVAQTKAPLAITNLEWESPYVGSIRPENELSILAVPILLNNKTIGVLNTHRSKNQFFTENEIKTIQAVSGKIAIALETGKLQRELSSEKNLLSGILSATTNGIIVVEKDLQISYINHAALKMLNLAASPNSLAELTSDASLKNKEPFKKTVMKVINEKICRISELETTGKTPRVIKTIFNTIPDKHGSSTAALIVLNDITEIKKKEQRVIEENKRVHDIVENTADGIMVFDPKGTITLKNRSSEKLISRLDHFGKKGDAGLNQFVQQILPETNALKTESVIKKDFLFKDQDGDDYWIEISFSAIRNERGHISFIIAIIRDIMKERMFKEKQKEFIYTIAHELRTPITAIKGYLSMVKEIDSSNFSPKQSLYIDRANSATDKLVILAEGILQAARIENEKVSFDIKPFKPNELVEEIAIGFKKKADLKKMTISIKNTDDNVTVVGDKDKVRQVIGNLVDNAIKYTNKGSISLSISKSEGMGRITIKDSGIGLSKKDQLRIFDKFYRVPNSEAIREGGTGLGLYISKKLITKQGGDIKVISQIGKGSRFILSLPLAKKGTYEK